MVAGSTTKRRRTGTDSSFNSATPSRPKSTAGRARGRPPNAPRDGRERPPSLAECFKSRCNDVLDRLNKKDHYNIFLEPVNTKDVAGYLDVIKQPMDFTTMRTKLSQQVYRSLGEFRKDLDLIWSNCLLFNGKEPTNVFSKKAIELRRLTEKLIVNTRQLLEKDREILHKWKEKHRKRRETMAANAATAAAKLHGVAVAIPSSLIVNRDHGDDALGHEGRDPMLSTEFTPQDDKGRTPEQNALAESLRLQYSGTTGLFKKGILNAPYPQYTKPDGSIVQIPLVRYNPSDDHWSVHDPQSVDLYRIDAAPQLYCDSLPPSRDYNPCRPQPNADSVFVKDYAQSLYKFVRENGQVAIEIVTELLSPELALKAQHDELSKQGLNMKEIAKRIKASKLKQKLSSPLYRPMQKWDADAIISLADEIERMNKTKLPLLPRLARTINELDGIKGLGKFMDKHLVREVDEVPIEIIDFAMPYGVSLATMSEIHRLAMAPALQLPPSHVRCIEALRRATQDFIARKGPGTAAKVTGASVLSPAQLHEVQLRSQTQKRHRRTEAERQASVIADHYRGVSESRAMHAHANETKSTLGIQRPGQEPNVKMDVKLQGNIQAAAAAQLASVQGRVSQPLSQPMVSQLPPSNKDSFCKNCGTRDTLGWRPGAVAPDGVERLCIPCGLYWQKSHRHRPKELWAQTSVRQQQPSGSPVSERAPIRQAHPQSRSLTPAGSPNGVARPSIRKRTPQSSSRRSPSSGGSHRRAPKGITSGGVSLEQSNVPHGLQHMPGLPNSIHAATRRIQGHSNASLQGLSEQQPAIPGANITTMQNTQALYDQTQRSNPIPYAGNLPSGHDTNGQIQQVNASVMNASMFSGQEAGGVQLQRQVPNIPAGVSLGFLTPPKHTMGQIVRQQTSLQAPGLIQNTGNAQIGQHPLVTKNASFLQGNRGISPSGITDQMHMNNLGRSVQMSAHKVASDMQFGQPGRQVPVPPQNQVPNQVPNSVSNPVSNQVPNHLPPSSGGIGSIGYSPYATQTGNLSSNNVVGFENGSVNPVANNGGTSTVPSNSEQMMESLLFGDGGIIASPAGPPEFDF